MLFWRAARHQPPAQGGAAGRSAGPSRTETRRGRVGPRCADCGDLGSERQVSERMVQSTDVFIGYRTNPHLDMRERGAEAAAAIREMLGGLKPQRAFIRLPIVPSTGTMLTAAGPYADMINFGQRRMTPEIMNFSVMGGFAFADTAKNGLTVVVTARHNRQGAGGRDRRTRLGQPGAFLSAAYLAPRGRRESRRRRPRSCLAGPRLCRCRRQPGRRWARQHDILVACVSRGGPVRRAARCLFRPGSRRRGASPRGWRLLRRAVQPIGEYQVLRALHRAGDGGRV
jgi:hypothetical protein